MNTIKIEKDELTINLRDVKKGQIVNIIINEKTNNTEELLAAILAELQKSEIKEVEIEQEKSKIDIFNFWDSVNPKAVEAIKKATEGKTKRWKPKLGERYWIVNFWGNFYSVGGNDAQLNEHNISIGNYYQEHEQELAIWEQVTCRKYETALWDAADWVSDNAIVYYGIWGIFSKEIQAIKAQTLYNGYCSLPLPRFASRQSAIDAHTRILGDDAERYFKGRK
jgi:hypothetical protein